jgi:YVTN family beta-propeller protein
LQVVDGDEEVPVASAKERALLAVLLLYVGEVVSRDRLIEELWGEAPPPTANKALNVHVSQLRKTLARNGDAPIATRPRGYVLTLDPELLDAARFERCVGEARDRAGIGEVEVARRLLREAVALWRGDALEDVELEGTARNEIARLEELRLAATMERIDCDLALGLHEQLIGELEVLVAAHPLRERLRGQLMLALYRSGRQADALACYRTTRETLVRELGIEPSVPLQRLERAILTQDASLEAPLGVARLVESRNLSDGIGPPAHPRLRRRRLVLGLALLLAVGAGAAATVVVHGGGAPAVVDPNSVAVIDPSSNRIVYSVPVGDRPLGPVTDGATVWTASADRRTLSRLPSSRAQPVLTVGTGTIPAAIAVAAGNVWVSNLGSPDLSRIDGRFGTVEEEVPIAGADRRGISGVLTARDGAIWLARRFERLRKIDPATKAVVRTYDVVTRGEALAVGFGAAWVGAIRPKGLVRVSEGSGRATDVPLVHAPRAVATGLRSVWVVVAGDDKVWRIDPRTDAVTATIPVGGEPTGIAVGGGAVWVTSASRGTVERIDPISERVVADVRLGHAPSGVAFAHGRVWVAVRASPSEEQSGVHTTSLLATIETGQDAGITTGAGSVWVAEHREATLARVDPATNDVVARIPVGALPTNPAYGAGAVWLPEYGNNRISRIDPTTNRVTAAIPGLYYDVTVGYGSVWAITWKDGDRDWISWGGRTLARIDPQTNRVSARIDLPGTLFSVSVGGGSVWVSSATPTDPNATGSIWRIDPGTNRIVDRIRLRHSAGHVAFGFGSLWATAATAHLLRIDPRTHRVLARLRTSTGGPINYDYLTIGENAVWVVNLNNIIDAVLVSVDPATNQQTTTIALPDGPQGIASGFGSVWVSMFASAKVLRFAP